VGQNSVADRNEKWVSFQLPLTTDVSDVEKGREINRFTLFGEFEPCFVALLTVWKQQQGSTRSLDELLVLHMNRGAVMVSQSRLL
jgi:DNA sulfur modification protein DndE